MEATPFSTASPHRARLRDAVESLVVVERESRQLEARRQTALAEIAEIAAAESERFTTDSRSIAMPHRAAAIETGHALATSDRAATALLDHATSLTTDYPTVHASLADARIGGGHARAICHHGTIITDATARTAYAEEILEIASRETVGRTWHLAKLLAHKYACTDQTARHTDALAHRRTSVTDLDDGVAEYRILMDAAYAYAIDDRLSQQARLIQDDERVARHQAATDTDADPESLPTVRALAQIRADLATDLLLNGTPTNDTGDIDLTSIRARIQVTVPVLTLLPDHAGGAHDPDEHPDLRVAGLQGAATLAGYGPIHIETARLLAGLQAGWDRISCHPETGQVLSVDRYRPSEAIKRHVIARDQHCRAPGCTVPAHRADLDHAIDAAYGGATSTDNLTALCRRHHVNKHHAGMRMRLLPGGDVEWTTPLGAIIRDHPVSRTAHAPKRPGADRPPGGTGQRPHRVRFTASDPADDEHHPF